MRSYVNIMTKTQIKSDAQAWLQANWENISHKSWPDILYQLRTEKNLALTKADLTAICKKYSMPIKGLIEKTVQTPAEEKPVRAVKLKPAVEEKMSRFAQIMLDIVTEIEQKLDFNLGEHKKFLQEIATDTQSQIDPEQILKNLVTLNLLMLTKLEEYLYLPAGTLGKSGARAQLQLMQGKNTSPEF